MASVATEWVAYRDPVRDEINEQLKALGQLPLPPDLSGLYNLGGVPWWEAPIPRRWHRCKPQTKGWSGRMVFRCACGASAVDDTRHWFDRNQRRRGRR
jgi:hypothetical protein